MIKLQNILLSLYFQTLTVIFLVILFVILVYASVADYPTINTNMSVADTWSAYGGISVPLTFILYLLSITRQQQNTRRANLSEIYASIELFISDIDLFVEHIPFPFSFNLSLLTSLDMKKQKDLYAIGLILYRLSYLSSIKQHDDRRNYLIRIKIDHFLNLLTESKILNNKIYSKSNLKPINGELEGDKLLRKLTDDSYQMQRKFISEIDQEEKETILMNIKNKLSL